jgi:hypothetical protein
MLNRADGWTSDKMSGHETLKRPMKQVQGMVQGDKTDFFRDLSKKI